MKYLAIAFAIMTSSATYAQDISGKSANPGSLWTNSAKDILADRVARKEGDVITIIVSETSSSSFKAETTGSKNDSTSINKGVGPILANLIPNWAIGAKSSNSGKGATTQAGTFSAKITAVVKKVYPNGTMLIEGVRSITRNKETQNFSLSGVIRKEDVRSDNSVLSENIANAVIKADGKGMISDRQRRGILSRLLDWLL